MPKVKLILVSQANGGVSEYLKNFINYIDKDKYEITVILSNQYKIEEDKFLSLGCNIYFVNMVRKVDIINDFLAICSIKKIIKDIKPDLIYAHSSKAGVLVRLAISHKRTPIIYNAHGWAFNMNISKIKKKIYASIEKICAYNTSKVVCISDYERNSALDYNICNKYKMEIVYNGIDLKKAIKVDKNNILGNIGFPEDSFIIGQVGRLDEQKNPLLFVDIAKAIIEENINAYFILVGDGNLKDEVENRIKEYNLKDRFYITGWTSTVMDYVSCFNVGMLTSKWEGFGLALVEYMALGVPIVASNVDGIPDVVEEGINGILCNPNNKEEFVNSLKKIIFDKDFLNELSINGQKAAIMKFSMERVIKEHYEIFNNLVNN